MFSRSEKKIYSPDFEFILRGKESNVCSISLPGNMNLSMTGLHCNGFSEDGCLTDKFRVHGQIDNFGAEAELFSVAAAVDLDHVAKRRLVQIRKRHAADIF